MKKINSIWYGGKIILTGSIFAFILPLGISLFPIKSKILTTLSSLSIICGLIILIGFGIFLAIELHQDRRLNSFYKEEQRNKVKIRENKYECQVCGNREINQYDSSCKICGCRFENEGN
ncbi:MAG: hypothetical protein ACERKZ_18735 [Lachnotalea sp.]